MLDPATLPAKATQQEVAAWLGISPATLRTWHEKGTAPPKVRLGKKVYYIRDTVAAWLREREQGAAD